MSWFNVHIFENDWIIRRSIPVEIFNISMLYQLSCEKIKIFYPLSIFMLIDKTEASKITFLRYHLSIIFQCCTGWAIQKWKGLLPAHYLHGLIVWKSGPPALVEYSMLYKPSSMNENVKTFTSSQKFFVNVFCIDQHLWKISSLDL